MNADIVDLEEVLKGVLLDLRYATNDNITGKQLYKNPKAILRREVAEVLGKVADKLSRQGLVLVVWDTYRPNYVQKQLQEVCPDHKYVAKISNHSRGISVDVTLANKSGECLDMGTGFDDFSEKASPATLDVSPAQKANRKLLADAMTVEGFRQNDHEWWHFDFMNGKKELLNIKL